MISFLWGAIAMGCWMAGLVFFRFYRQSKDRLFALFGVGFWLLALNWLLLVAVHPTLESRHYVYLIRLAAFLVFLYAIFDKNRKR